MPGILGLVENVFGSDDLTQVAAAVEDGSVGLPTLRSLYEIWPSWASTVRIEQPAPGVLQPYVFASWGGLPHDGLAAAWPKLAGHADGASQLRSQLFRHLLFCDAVAVPDPFVTAEAPGSPLRPRTAGMVTDEQSIRQWVGNALRMMAEYSSLIRDGIIQIVPYPATVSVREIAEIDRALTDAEIAAFADQPPSWLGISYAGLAAASLLTQLRTAETWPGLDPYFPTDGYWTVFRRMHELSGVAVDDGNLPRLSKFLECELPEPGDLRVKDIVAIRRDGHFSAWRRAVAEGIVKYEALVGDGEDLISDARARALREEISANVDDLARTAKEDLGWLGKPAVNASIELSLIGAAAGAAFVAPPIAAGLAGLAAVPLLARTFRRWRKGRGALARHVAVFRRAR
jgi:hypothetical protein